MIEKQKVHNADMVVCGKKNYIERTANFVNGNLFENDIYCNREEAVQLLLLKSVTAWNKLYRRHLFDSIVYPEGRIGEDSHIIMDLLKRCNSVEIIAEELYVYNVRNNSIMTSPFKPNDIHMLEDNVNHYLEIKEYYVNAVDVGEYNIYLITVILMNKISRLHWKLIKEYKPYIDACRAELKNIVGELSKNRYVYLKLKLAVVLIYYTPYLYILERKFHEFRKSN